MFVTTADSANELFTRASKTILNEGRPVAPRGMATTELMGTYLKLTDPAARMVALPARTLNPAFAAAETVWILSGSDDNWICDFNSRLGALTDHGTLQGAYGPRLRRWHSQDQLDYIRLQLMNDCQSRRAVIQIFDPCRDTAGYKDVPCTLGYRFYVRENRLEMHTSMRSQDAWLGLPYDLITATVLQELMAGWLGVDVGDYHHHVDSLHLYAQHQDAARDLADDAPASTRWQPLAVPWSDFDQVLKHVIEGEPVGHPVWDGFAAVLASYRLWKAGRRDEARSKTTAPGLFPQALAAWYDQRDQHLPLAAMPAPVPKAG
ncbi:thymidylate synthase [Nonomuraea basaltis]|uniref:thymidylate synthase n=1 Tax=Nonomuraea basaltis TaxID=2495887 RepID=UPI00110C5DB5|nr:thymidylate synthase [Nonomuraea basaltis]TMR99495.1 thymidylate synthase [Nonomuraea basaltis]